MLVKKLKSLPGIRAVLSSGAAVMMVAACSTNGYDDEAINRRSSYRDEDNSSSLPSPAQAADEAKQYQKSQEERKVTEVGGSDANIDADGSGGLTDITAAYAQISVPSGVEEQPFFAPVKGRIVLEGTRRKPIFLGKLGIEALLSGAQLGAPATALPGAGGGMRLSARAGRGAIVSREGMGTYIVRPGDTLSSISVHIYATSGRWMELAHLNRLGNGSIIFPNELILYVPDKTSTP